MSKDLDKYGLIDDYLRNEMTPLEKENFENELKNDQDLLAEVEAQKLTHEAVFQVEALSLRNELQEHFQNKQKSVLIVHRSVTPIVIQ